MNAGATHPAARSLHGRRFVMESSTNSIVDPLTPSQFQYFERDGLVWGDYDGDTVRFGRFLGTRIGDELKVRFAHVSTVGDIITGSGDSTVEETPAGLRLVERFRLDGVDHVSVCVEVI